MANRRGQPLPNEDLAPIFSRYDIKRKNNVYFDPDDFTCAYPIWIPILRQHRLWYAISHMEKVSETYMQQFWRNIIVSRDKTQCNTRLNTTDIQLSKRLIQEILDLGAANAEYDPELSEEEIIAAHRELGYEGSLPKVAAFTKTRLVEPWSTLFMFVNKCLSPKHTGYDRANIHIQRIFLDLAFNRRGDYALHIWRDLLESIKFKDTNKSGKVLPFQRFTGLFIKHFCVLHPEIIPREDIFVPDRARFFSAPRNQIQFLEARPRVIPYALLQLAGRGNNLVNQYRRQYYIGNQLTANPLTEAELDEPEEQPEQQVISSDSEKTASAAEMDGDGSSDDDGIPPPPSPRTKAALDTVRANSKDDAITRRRKTMAKKSSRSSLHRKSMKASASAATAAETLAVTASVSLPTSASAVSSIPTSPVSPPTTSTSVTSTVASLATPVITEAQTTVMSALTTVEMSAAASDIPTSSSDSLDFDYGVLIQEQDYRTPEKAVLSSTTLTAENQSMVTTTVATSVAATMHAEPPRIDVSTIRLLPSTLTPPSVTVMAASSVFVSFVLVPSVPVLPLTTLTTATTSSAMPPPPPLYTTSTTGPSFTRSESIWDHRGPPILFHRPDVDPPWFNVDQFKKFDEKLTDTLHSQTSHLMKAMKNQFKDMGNSLLQEMRKEYRAAHSSTPQAPQAPKARSYEELQLQFEDLTTDEMMAALFLRLISENPDSNATDLSSFFIEQEQCKQAELKKRKRHDDPDDSSSHHEGEESKLSRATRSGRGETGTNSKQPLQSSVPQQSSTGKSKQLLASLDQIFQDIDTYTAEQPSDESKSNLTYLNL